MTRKTPALLLALSMGITAPALAEEPVTATLDADGVQRAAIVLDSYSYTPGHLIVQAGKPVELKLTKEGFAPHDFVIDDAAAGFTVKEDVGGDGKTLRFTPMNPGKFAIYCSKKAPIGKSHREKGMEGVLEVR
ncbi:MAG: quinol oxidase [Gammaproteobacteria bacterium]|nr:quinol oxidase [Gammaproteobacteria bacterium]